MNEIIFLVEENPEGGFMAKAVGYSIYTEAETVNELKDMLKDAVLCHFEDEIERPKLIRLHHVKEEVIAA
jgi:predicted RNase H-like HicB family nuclease